MITATKLLTQLNLLWFDGQTGKGFLLSEKLGYIPWKHALLPAITIEMDCGNHKL